MSFSITYYLLGVACIDLKLLRYGFLNHSCLDFIKLFKKFKNILYIYAHKIFYIIATQK